MSTLHGTSDEFRSRVFQFIVSVFALDYTELSDFVAKRHRVDSCTSQIELEPNVLEFNGRGPRPDLATFSEKRHEACLERKEAW